MLSTSNVLICGATILLLVAVAIADDLKLTICQTNSNLIEGEPIPYVLVMENDGKGDLRVFRQAMDESRSVSGHKVILRQTNGQEVLPTVPYRHEGERYVAAKSSVTDQYLLDAHYKLLSPGTYSLQIRNAMFVHHLSFENGVERCVPRKVWDVLSPAVKLRIESADTNLVASIEKLLQSKSERDAERAVHILETVRVGVLKKVLPSLWSFIRARHDKIKYKAIKVLFSRVEVAIQGVPLKEFFAEWAAASMYEDASIRVAAARILPVLKQQWIYHGDDDDGYDYFVGRRVRTWFSTEKSEECRAVLASLLSVDESVYHLIQNDPSLRVRGAALQKLLDEKSGMVEDSCFSNIAAKVELEGEMLTVGMVLAREREKVRIRLMQH